MTSKRLPTFDIENPRDMLDKLLREIKRLERTDDREDAADHCFNAAVTAWHIQDWIWREAEDGIGLKNEIAEMAGINLTQFNQRCWKEFLTAACPALQICRILANASKHGNPAIAATDPEDLKAYGSPISDARWKIRVGGEIQLAKMVFEQAFAYWNELIRGLNIADSGLGQLDETAVMPEQE